ncbi:MAG: TonB-dependent receptor plug domain-containing protein [Saprospiraceae bacterium]|nr:TonB-dependent receptor plug domain-containing protein [Saprospiraceae bacterium]
MFQSLCFKRMAIAWIAMWLMINLNAQKTVVIVRDYAGKGVEDASVSVNGYGAITDHEGRVEGEFRFPLHVVVTYVGTNGLDTIISEQTSKVELILLGTGILLKEGLVTASWANESSAVTQKTLSKSRIYSDNPADMPSILESLPGSVSTSDAGNGIGYSALRIRGSDQTRINVTIDGVPVNDAESQDIFWVDLPDIIEDVESVQIQRGVGVSTAGPGAFGANINLRTGMLSKIPLLTANVGYGSFNSQKYGLALSSGVLGKYFRFKIRGSRISSDGYMDRASSQLWAGSFQSQYVRQRFSLAANVYWGKEETYQAWEGTPIQFYKADPGTTFNPAGLKSDGAYYSDQKDFYRQVYSRLIGRWHITQNSGLQFTLYNTLGKGYYNQYREENISKYFDDVPSMDVALIRERWLDNALNGLNLVFDHQNNGWFLQTGGNLQLYRGKHFGIIKNYQGLPDWVPRYYYDNIGEKQEASVFARIEKTLDRIGAFVDLQGRRIAYTYEGLENEWNPEAITQRFLFFNPKVGATIFLNENKDRNIYIFGGVANKEPNRRDFTDAAPGKLPKPERMYNGEMGYRHSKQNFDLQSNIYFMFYQDQLVLTGKINDVGAYTRFNVDKSYRMGWETDLRWQPFQQLTILGNISLSKSKIIDFTEYSDVSILTDEGVEYPGQVATFKGNTDIAFSPFVVAYGKMSYQPFMQSKQLKGLSFQYTYKLVGSQYIDNTSDIHSKLPSYNLHGMGFSLPLRIGKNGFVLSGNIDNLLNIHYVNNGWIYRFKAIGYDASKDDPYIQSEGNDYYSSVGYFPQAGRRVFVSLRYMLK